MRTTKNIMTRKRAIRKKVREIETGAVMRFLAFIRNDKVCHYAFGRYLNACHDEWLRQQEETDKLKQQAHYCDPEVLKGIEDLLSTPQQTENKEQL